MSALAIAYVLVYGFWAMGALGVGYVAVMDWADKTSGENHENR